jgi:hypothetical protein
MNIEENLPERFINSAFHPSLFVYAWKRNTLDKLFEELMQSNVAIVYGEAWRVEGDEYFGIIPFKNGSKAVLSWKIEQKEGEEWYDFVERSMKDSLEAITSKDLEKKTSAVVRSKIYYHFKFAVE